jgi:hypothetical protein
MILVIPNLVALKTVAIWRNGSSWSTFYSNPGRPVRLRHLGMANESHLGLRGAKIGFGKLRWIALDAHYRDRPIVILSNFEADVIALAN